MADIHLNSVAVRFGRTLAVDAVSLTIALPLLIPLIFINRYFITGSPPERSSADRVRSRPAAI